MAPSGSSGFVALVLVLVFITTFPFSSSSQQTGIYANNQTFGGSKQTHSHLPSTVKDNCTIGTTNRLVYSGEQFGLLVAITRHDLHRFANYSCDVQCAARWIQLSADIRKVNCRFINQNNCSHYAYPVKKDDLAKLSQHYSVDCGRGDRSVCSWAAYQPENSRPDYYAQMVIKWVAGMKQVEQYRSSGSLYCYNLPTDFDIKSRREEFNATIMHSFRQNMEVGWYFEHFTLANFLKPFCGHKAVLHSNPYTFRYFVITLNAYKYLFTQSTVESTRQYMFSICPVYGTQFDTLLNDDDDDLYQPMPYKSYLKTSMIVPDIMHRYVSRVLASDILVYENGNDNMTILSGDAFKWICEDFTMMVQRNPDYNSSVHRSINRKILFYLLVPQMQQHYMQAQQKKQKKKMEHKYSVKEVMQVEKGKKSPFGPYLGYITVGLFILLVVLSVLFYLYYSSGSKKTLYPDLEQI